MDSQPLPVPGSILKLLDSFTVIPFRNRDPADDDEQS